MLSILLMVSVSFALARLSDIASRLVIVLLISLLFAANSSLSVLKFSLIASKFPLLSPRYSLTSAALASTLAKVLVKLSKVDLKFWEVRSSKNPEARPITVSSVPSNSSVRALMGASCMFTSSVKSRSVALTRVSPLNESGAPLFTDKEMLFSPMILAE